MLAPRMLWGLALLPLFTACAAQPQLVTKFSTVEIKPPLALLRCSDEPAAPGDPLTDLSVAIFIIDLADAGRDCREAITVLRNRYFPLEGGAR